MKDDKNSNAAIASPLCVGFLDKLNEDLYREQFFDYDGMKDAKDVLDELQNLKNNPKLLDYVIKCLASQNISTVPNNFFCVVINEEKRPEYDEKIHGSFEKYKKHCVDDDFGTKKWDHLLPKVYDSFGEIEGDMMKYDGNDIRTKFEKYTIHKIG